MSSFYCEECGASISNTVVISGCKHYPLSGGQGKWQHVKHGLPNYNVYKNVALQIRLETGEEFIAMYQGNGKFDDLDGVTHWRPN